MIIEPRKVSLRYLFINGNRIVDYWSPTITLNAGFEVAGGTAFIASPTTFPCCLAGNGGGQPENDNKDERVTPTSLKVIPNPFGDVLQVTYEIKEEIANTQLYMTDLSGKVIKNIKIDSAIKGSQNIEIKTNDLMNGIYFIHFKNGKYRETQKVVKANKN